MERLALATVLCFGLGAPAVLRAADAGREEKAEGYAEWRHGDVLVVDGQRVRAAAGVKFKGEADARDFKSIPLGYEVKAKGTRAADGTLLAKELQAKPNGSALFESEVREVTDGAEAGYRKAGAFFQFASNGRAEVIGRLHESGPMVERVRRIVDDLVPPYINPDDVRCYVIENKDWNAFAMGNFSIYVFSGLLDDMDDDEVAIVLGHEIAHATHEHTRRQFKKQMWIQLALLGVAATTEAIDDRNKRAVANLLAQFGAMAWSSGYGRDLEDQADRVGLRYAYEAGYDISKGPLLWRRFAKKYGESGKVANFFFGDHALSSARAANLQRQLALNYPEGPKPGGVRDASVRPPGPNHDESSQPEPALALAASGTPSNKEIKVGMTPDEVRGLLGKPQEEVVLGSRSKWIYPGMTVLFEGGRVSDVKF